MLIFQYDVETQNLVLSIKRPRDHTQKPS